MFRHRRIGQLLLRSFVELPVHPLHRCWGRCSVFLIPCLLTFVFCIWSDISPVIVSDVLIFLGQILATNLHYSASNIMYNTSFTLS